MRSLVTEYRAFLGGIAVGLLLAGVTVVTTEAARRARRRRDVARRPRPVMHTVDGVRPLEEAELDARPASEANSVPRRLESEAVDVPSESQRW